MGIYVNIRIHSVPKWGIPHQIQFTQFPPFFGNSAKC